MKVKAKKIPYYLLLLLLATGASLILGLLSFGGMFVLFPTLTVAGMALTLSVAYEGEIYLQNISGALKKLFFKNDYLQNHLANEYLLEKFPDTKVKCPQFFKDYEAQLHLLHAFGHKRLSKEDAARKKLIEKTLGDMEKWFATQLFPKAGDRRELSEYEQELRDWLALNGQAEQIELLEQRRATYNAVKIFSLFAGFFMGYGTTYLLVEAFEVIPFLVAIPAASLPMLIVPMAIVAGSAYGFLTFNAVTDMINNDTVRKWYHKIKRNVQEEGFTPRNLFITATALFLLSLTLALTACTAGTWWTVAQNTRPLFPWMKNVPSYVMGFLNPLITSMSALVFNMENTSESLEMIEEMTESKFPRNAYLLENFPNTKDKDCPQFFKDYKAQLKLLHHYSYKHLSQEDLVQKKQIINELNRLETFLAKHLAPTEGELVNEDEQKLRTWLRKHPLKTRGEKIVQAFKAFRERENWGQIVNPARLVLAVTITPLRVLLFLGHLVSIGVTADRMPGVPEIVSAILGIVSEGFEDVHYFLPHEHVHSHSTKGLLEERLEAGHGHDHSADLPTRILKLITLPIYGLATLWDSAFSQFNNPKQRLGLGTAWDKQTGQPSVAPRVELDQKDVDTISEDWRRHQADFRIKRFKDAQLSHVVMGQTLAKGKAEQLSSLQHDKLRQKGGDQTAAAIIREEAQQPIYKIHRTNGIFGLFSHKTTTTEDFLADLSHRVSSPAA